ncbi:MAG: DUF2029 domain-containing protein [Planctomycetes bacterium]|nr:DUF2029 domain-containing protein [Planctomycetota bacterium]
MNWLFPSDTPAIARRDRALGVLLALLIVALVARAALKQDGVLVRNQAFGARVLAGQDPYFDVERGRRMHAPYPPSFTLVAVPLACLPTTAARVAWATLQGAALVAAFLLLRSLAREHAGELAVHAPVWFALALLLVSRFLLRDASGGGGNLIYATLALASLCAAERGRSATAGWLFATTWVLKPNLAPLALFFVATRRVRVLAWTLFAALVLWAVPAPFFGPSAWWNVSRRWASDVLAYSTLDDLHDDAAVPDGMPRNDSSMNQALRAALDRLLRPSDSARIDDVHVATLEPETVAWIARAASCALLAAGWVVGSFARGARARWWAALGFLPVCLLVAPIAWKAHHVALLPLAFALVACAHRTGSRALQLGLVVYWLACDLASEELLGKAAKNLLQAVSVITWFDVLLVVAAWTLALRDRPRVAARE